MLAKQYEITLPADYDLAVIRRRIEAGAPLLDDRPGLGLKAWLLRERGADGSPVNQYAPFYVWRSDGAAARFLVGGGGFENIVRDFGRPTVRHWTVLAHFSGPARAAVPVPPVATRRLSTVPTDPDPLALAAHVERATEEVRELARHPEVHTAVLALDPDRWELLRFVLRTAVPAAPDDPAAPDGSTAVFRVPHLSAPELSALPEGRAW
ncbi:DUF4865 domain-containing protein [Kitasatospora phosalacinea]|uniref:DUF4865 domain-containing protein n=1 Tax=Kitasatospora phosalacinea TaxID=2065 RepID=A0A9W6V3Y1_9ACTN|nr:DUF4865 family protein [Kitasatospora phosalacinea]GLW74884.1 DUF4865 domain-containing protein [Kitasatospora phosalacinea]